MTWFSYICDASNVTRDCVSIRLLLDITNDSDRGQMVSTSLRPITFDLGQITQRTSVNSAVVFFIQDGTVSIKNVHFDDHVVGVKELTIKWGDLVCYQRIEVS